MAEYLIQKYQEIPKALIPYVPRSDASQQMALITIEPALPCFLCGQPAMMALIAPAPDYASGNQVPWLTFPICEACEERQVKAQAAMDDE